MDTKSSSIKSPALAIKESSSGLFNSSAKYLPTILSSRLSITSPASMTAFFKIPFLVPQSSLVTIKSCATSTSLLVKYPEFAVFKAVSAKPFLAPWVELKYSKTLKPSLKFDIIGVSIISPLGFAIKPLMPASCFI